jgi:hypothetical protein
MQHRVKLSTFAHTKEAVDQEGRNWQLVTCEAVHRAAVLTSKSHIHLYRVSAAKGVSLLPMALLQLADTLEPAELKLYQSLDLRPYGTVGAVAAGLLLAIMTQPTFLAVAALGAMLNVNCRHADPTHAPSLCKHGHTIVELCCGFTACHVCRRARRCCRAGAAHCVGIVDRALSGRLPSIRGLPCTPGPIPQGQQRPFQRSCWRWHQWAGGPKCSRSI